LKKICPEKFISKSGFEITSAGKKYLRPLIQGQAPTNYVNGIPDVAVLKKVLVKKRLRNF